MLMNVANSAELMPLGMFCFALDWRRENSCVHVHGSIVVFVPRPHESSLETRPFVVLSVNKRPGLGAIMKEGN